MKSIVAPHRLLRGIATAALAALGLAGIGVVAFIAYLLIGSIIFNKRELRDRYDRSDATYRYITSHVSEDHRPSVIDLSKINGGDWQFLCVIGAYNDPVKILREEAQRRNIVTSDIEPVPKLTFSSSSIWTVEEYEGAISFVDRQGRGRTVLIDGFERLAYQHNQECFGPETREITLPLR